MTLAMQKGQVKNEVCPAARDSPKVSASSWFCLAFDPWFSSYIRHLSIERRMAVGSSSPFGWCAVPSLTQDPDRQSSNDVSVIEDDRPQVWAVGAIRAMHLGYSDRRQFQRTYSIIRRPVSRQTDLAHFMTAVTRVRAGDNGPTAARLSAEETARE